MRDAYLIAPDFSGNDLSGADFRDTNLEGADLSGSIFLTQAQVNAAKRDSSYISGDLWESRTSHALSCAWTYAYPYVSGKVNFCITGMHHGMKRRKVYPEGMHIISIPYQKILEVVTALDEMDWELIAMKEDQESKDILAAKMANWERMSQDFILKE